MKAAFSGRALFNRWALTAPVMVVVCAAKKAFTHGLGTRVQQIDYDQVDIGIATEHFVLQATELGLGTCWIGWFNEKKVKEILEVPRRIRVYAMLTVGYRDPTVPIRGEGKSLEDEPVTNRKPREKIAFAESYGTPFPAASDQQVPQGRLSGGCELNHSSRRGNHG